MATQITLSQLAEVKALSAAGRIGEAWQRLGTFGDAYARSAAQVILEPTSFYGSVVRNIWAAANADFIGKFTSVATEHQNNYLAEINNNNGILPNTTFIEGSYLQAVGNANIPLYAAVDALLARLPVRKPPARAAGSAV